MFHSFRVSDSFDEASGPSDYVPSTGLLVHYDAELGVTIDTGQVVAWADQSGNGNNLNTNKVGTITVIPAAVNGLASIRFQDASIDITGAPSPFLNGKTGCTIFMVMLVNTVNNDVNDVIDARSAGGAGALRIEFNDGNLVRVHARNETDTLQTGAHRSHSGGAYRVMQIVIDWALVGSEFQVWRNATFVGADTVTGSSFVNPFTKFGLGSSAPPPESTNADFRLAELKIYDNAFSTEDREAERDALNTKYGSLF
jgi:hypothetical protein